MLLSVYKPPSLEQDLKRVHSLYTLSITMHLLFSSDLYSVVYLPLLKSVLWINSTISGLDMNLQMP